VFIKQFDKGQTEKVGPVVEQREEQSGVDIRV